MTKDENACEEIVRQLETAWNAYDSAGWAALFAENANFIQIYGGQLEGRAAIEASHRCIFDTIYKDSNATFTGARRLVFASRRGDRLYARAPEVLSGRASVRNGLPPDVDSSEGTGKVANRVPAKHQDFGYANGSAGGPPPGELTAGGYTKLADVEARPACRFRNSRVVALNSSVRS